MTCAINELHTNCFQQNIERKKQSTVLANWVLFNVEQKNRKLSEILRVACLPETVCLSFKIKVWLARLLLLFYKFIFNLMLILSFQVCFEPAMQCQLIDFLRKHLKNIKHKHRIFVPHYQHHHITTISASNEHKCCIKVIQLNRQIGNLVNCKQNLYQWLSLLLVSAKVYTNQKLK